MSDDLIGWTPMSPAAFVKDWLGFVFSSAALVISLQSYFQKKNEGRQAIRKQLTDILQEITELNLKDATFRSLVDKSAYPSNYIGLLADQRRFLVRQAASLVERIVDLVNSHELVLIANTFLSVDYVEDAESFYKRAKDAKQTDIDKGLALRTYARFLFDQSRVDEGRAIFMTAIAIFSERTDRQRFYTWDTYARWAEEELRICGDLKEAHRLFDDARETIEGIEVAGRRATQMERMETRKKELFPVEDANLSND